MNIKILLCITALLSLTGSSLAQNWQGIGGMADKEMIQVDLDSIRHTANGTSVSIMIAGQQGELMFDCEGHVQSNDTPPKSIKPGSIAAHISDMVCSKEPE